MADAKKTTTNAPKAAITVEGLKFNPENKLMAILSTLGLIGGLIGLIEEKDMFVKYHGLQFGILSVIIMIVGFIPLLNLLSLLLMPVFFIIWLVGLMKVLKGETFVMPMISDMALSYMNR